MYLLNNYHQAMETVNNKELKKKILIVDDDLAVQSLLDRFFAYNNYQTEIASNCEIARKKLRSFQPDLVILDINLTDDTGLNLCQEISKNDVLIVVLSSMRDNSYVLEAFTKGADDYVTKPFDLQILKARIEALFRRCHNALEPSINKNSIIIDNLEINFYRREVILNDTSISLTALEFELLYFLANNPNRVWDRGELISAIWNKNDYEGDDRKVDIHVGRIRKKIGDKDGEFIKTVWGRGYMFELSSSNAVKLAD